MWFILYNIQTTLYKPLFYCNVLHYFSDFSTSLCYFCLLLVGYFMTFHDIIKTMFYVNELNIYTPCNTFFTIAKQDIDFYMLSFVPHSTRRSRNISSPNCYIILWRLDRIISLWMNHTGKTPCNTFFTIAKQDIDFYYYVLCNAISGNISCTLWRDNISVRWAFGAYTTQFQIF
jgi:hypothetical protein